MVPSVTLVTDYRLQAKKKQIRASWRRETRASTRVC